MKKTSKDKESKKAFGGMNPTDFFRKLRDDMSKKRTW